MTFKLSTAVRRGRPVAANDNTAAYAERADTVRALRQKGMTFRAIADYLGVSEWTTWSAINTRIPKRRVPVAANDNVVRRKVAYNGGCSTTSGLIKVSLPRVPTLEKPEIAPELAVAV